MFSKEHCLWVLFNHFSLQLACGGFAHNFLGDPATCFFHITQQNSFIRDEDLPTFDTVDFPCICMLGHEYDSCWCLRSSSTFIRFTQTRFFNTDTDFIISLACSPSFLCYSTDYSSFSYHDCEFFMILYCFFNAHASK